MEQILRIRVKPNSRVPRVGGSHDGRLVIAVAEPPEDGKATDAVRKSLAKALGLKTSDLELVRGVVSRDKDFRLVSANSLIPSISEEIWAKYVNLMG